MYTRALLPYSIKTGKWTSKEGGRKGQNEEQTSSKRHFPAVKQGRMRLLINQIYAR